MLFTLYGAEVPVLQAVGRNCHKAVTLWTRILGVFGSNLGRDRSYSD
jgi:hypothetical protein